MKSIFLTIFTVLLFVVAVNSYAYTLPPKDKEITVDIALYVNDITVIHEKTEVIEIELTLFQQWSDSRLKFDPKTTGSEVKYYYNNDARRKLNAIWNPNIGITEIRGEPEIQKAFLKINSDGLVTFIQRFNADVETVINVKKFPFDQQNLKITLSPFSKNYNQLKFSIDKRMEGIAPNAQLAEWKILGYSGKMITSHSIIMGDSVPEYVFTIKYQRQWLFYLFKLLLPLLIIVMLSWSVFWLKNQPLINSIAVTFTALLTIVAFQWVVTDAIPRVSYPTFFQSLILFSYVTIGLTIVALAVIDGVRKKTGYTLYHIFRPFFPIFYFIGILIIIVKFLLL